jgi:hypothetical protein
VAQFRIVAGGLRVKTEGEIPPGGSIIHCLWGKRLAPSDDYAAVGLMLPILQDDYSSLTTASGSRKLILILWTV